ncbi:Hypothetical protein, putative [Bodo saltans]|uniref:Uncharacterized protein n=1 Tax=Bodo saltans TaxID=75058 RepID=A0A0S4JJ58_BODSA|nr:Hypothetical protein, putative [Bodo saltans]|eukprot:CUG90575.1 Hypothetical protein, putative [Bodo saltans]
MQFSHHIGGTAARTSSSQLLSLIIDQRCFEDNAFIGHGVRNLVVDATLEVAHLAWWSGGGHSHNAQYADPQSQQALHPSAPLELEVHIITDLVTMLHTAVNPPPTSTECRLLLPRTNISSLEVIQDACGAAYQTKQSIPILAPAAASASLFTSAQVDAIRSVVLRDGNNPGGRGRSSFPATSSFPFESATTTSTPVDNLHVVLVTTAFDPKLFAARVASVLPPLVSLASQSIEVTVLFLDCTSKANASYVTLAPSIHVQRFPMTLPPRRCVFQMIRPILERWAAPCFTPHDLPVVLSIGTRAVQCLASCAVVSALPRWNVPLNAFPSSSSAVVNGWAVLENLYQDPASASSSSSASGAPTQSPQYRLRVERCVPRDSIDASVLMGESWHISPFQGIGAGYGETGLAALAQDGPGWWKALFDASMTAGPSGSGGVLILSTAGGSFFQSVSATIGLRVHEYVGMFAPDGASMLVRPLAPREIIRELPPCSRSQFPLRATEAMVSEVRGILCPESSPLEINASSSPHISYHGDVMSIIGAMYSQPPRRALQVVTNHSVNGNHQHHMNGKQAKRTSSGFSAAPQQQLHRTASSGRGGGVRTFPFSSS